MKTLRESLLSGIEDTINKGNDHIDEMCRLNWRMTYYDTTNFKAVPGGRKFIVEKYFGKKLEPISATMYVTFLKNYDLAKKNEKVYKTPAMWFEAIILNTKYDEPIDYCLKQTNIAPNKSIDDKLEYELNSRLLPEYKAIYDGGDPIFKTFTRWCTRPHRTEVIITIYLTSSVLKVDMNNDYGKLCEITLLYNNE